LGIRTRLVEYRDGETVFEGLLAWDDSIDGARPGVLVSHAWGGRGENEDRKSCALAELGYAGFALDLYGKGVRGRDKATNAALIRPFLDDRALLQKRMRLALEVLKDQGEVDADRTAAIGFCFGGLCVLDLARSGAELAGVVSFHGLLGAPGNTGRTTIAAKILVQHGWDDPMAPPEYVIELARELSAQGADWQLHAYGHTMHAFTNPQANDPGFGTVYHPDADRRSWRAMQDFLTEIFGTGG